MKIIKAPTVKEASPLELKNRALARKAAAEGFVLLENADTSIADYVWLPIDWVKGRPVLRWQDSWNPGKERKA